jgi:uncharacterized protein YkwD
VNTKQGYRIIRLLVVTTFCLVASQLFVATRVTFAQDSNKDMASQVLTEVNNWRMQEGLWPLKVNPTLETMALTQARYILPKLDSIQDEADYHKDDQGRMPQQRAAQAYNWPYYSNPAQVEVGENAAVGNVQYALKFWHESNIHRKAALSPVYREVGIAVLPYQKSYLILMDLGARPGVLPAFVNPEGDTLYPTDERSRYAGVKSGSTQVRIFDSQGKALTKSVPWAQTVELPKGLEGNIFVLYTNGTYQSMTRVQLANSGPAQPAVEAAAPTTAPATVPEATQVIAPTIEPTAQAAESTAIPKPSATPLENAPVILIYDDTSLVVYNNAPGRIDLSKFSVGSSVGKVAIESWSKVAPVPYGAFPPRNCLQIGINGFNPNTPTICKAIRAQIILNTGNVFWTKGSFDVKLGGDVIVTCDASAGRCEVPWAQK